MICFAIVKVLLKKVTWLTCRYTQRVYVSPLHTKKQHDRINTVLVSKMCKMGELIFSFFHFCLKTEFCDYYFITLQNAEVLTYQIRPNPAHQKVSPTQPVCGLAQALVYRFIVSELLAMCACVFVITAFIFSVSDVSPLPNIRWIKITIRFLTKLQ